MPRWRAVRSVCDVLTLAGEYAGMGMDSARSVEASATVDGSTTMLAVVARDASAAWEAAGLSVGAAVKAEQTARHPSRTSERSDMDPCEISQTIMWAL